MQRVTAGAAITEAGVEKAVGAKGDPAAVVVGERLLDGEDLLLGCAANVSPPSVDRMRARTERRPVEPPGAVREVYAVWLVCQSGANARPSRPVSPPAVMSVDGKESATVASVPLFENVTTLPPCSTT